MTMARPAWAITTSAPGSELAGETAAAMAAASILFKTAHPSKTFLATKSSYCYCPFFLEIKRDMSKDIKQYL